MKKAVINRIKKLSSPYEKILVTIFKNTFIKVYYMGKIDYLNKKDKNT